MMPLSVDYNLRRIPLSQLENIKGNLHVFKLPHWEYLLSRTPSGKSLGANLKEISESIWGQISEMDFDHRNIERSFEPLNAFLKDLSESFRGKREVLLAALIRVYSTLSFSRTSKKEVRKENFLLSRLLTEIIFLQQEVFKDEITGRKNGKVKERSYHPFLNISPYEFRQIRVSHNSLKKEDYESVVVALEEFLSAYPQGPGDVGKSSLVKSDFRTQGEGSGDEIEDLGQYLFFLEHYDKIKGEAEFLDGDQNPFHPGVNLQGIEGYVRRDDCIESRIPFSLKRIEPQSMSQSIEENAESIKKLIEEAKGYRPQSTDVVEYRKAFEYSNLVATFAKRKADLFINLSYPNNMSEEDEEDRRKYIYFDQKVVEWAASFESWLDFPEPYDRIIFKAQRDYFILARPSYKEALVTPIVDKFTLETFNKVPSVLFLFPGSSKKTIIKKVSQFS